MDDYTRVLKALSDEVRLRIIKLLQHKDSLCVCEIMQALGITQTRASRNLGILRDAGLLRSKKAGLWVEYSLAEKSRRGRVSALLRFLSVWIEDSDVLELDRKRLALARRVGSQASAK